MRKYILKYSFALRLRGTILLNREIRKQINYLIIILISFIYSTYYGARNNSNYYSGYINIKRVLLILNSKLYIKHYSYYLGKYVANK